MSSVRRWVSVGGSTAVLGIAYIVLVTAYRALVDHLKRGVHEDDSWGLIGELYELVGLVVGVPVLTWVVAVGALYVLARRAWRVVAPGAFLLAWPSAPLIAGVCFGAAVEEPSGEARLFFYVFALFTSRLLQLLGVAGLAATQRQRDPTLEDLEG